jgi:hypothetical protein
MLISSISRSRRRTSEVFPERSLAVLEILLVHLDDPALRNSGGSVERGLVVRVVVLSVVSTEKENSPPSRSRLPPPTS